MNLTLVFSRKYRWPEHYFSVWCLGSSQKLLTTNQFLVGTIFFTIMNIPFFNLRFDLFLIVAKVVNQIRNNAACVVGRLVFVFCCALTTGRCNAFQHIFKIGVLRPIFPDYIISCDYDIIKCTVFLLNMKFGQYLKVLNNKSIMFKQLITVGIWWFCIVGSLSDESHSISAARFCCTICDKTWSQLKITDNILLSKFWGIKVSFSFSKFLSIEIFLLNKLNKEAVYSGMLETSILFTLGKLPGNVTYWA